jgi:hypothetical protein
MISLYYICSGRKWGTKFCCYFKNNRILVRYIIILLKQCSCYANSFGIEVGNIILCLHNDWVVIGTMILLYQSVEIVDNRMIFVVIIILLYSL